jgi:hypothetical protein
MVPIGIVTGVIFLIKQLKMVIQRLYVLNVDVLNPIKKKKEKEKD